MIPTILFVLYVSYGNINDNHWVPYGFFQSKEACHAALLAEQAKEKDLNMSRSQQCIGYEIQNDVHIQ